MLGSARVVKIAKEYSSSCVDGLFQHENSAAAKKSASVSPLPVPEVSCKAPDDPEADIEEAVAGAKGGMKGRVPLELPSTSGTIKKGRRMFGLGEDFVFEGEAEAEAASFLTGEAKAMGSFFTPAGERMRRNSATEE